MHQVDLKCLEDHIPGAVTTPEYITIVDGLVCPYRSGISHQGATERSFQNRPFQIGRWSNQGRPTDPFLKILFKFLLSKLITYFYPNNRFTIGIQGFPIPRWLCESLALKINSQGRCKQIYTITKTKGAFETNPTETNCMKRSFIRIAETAERSKMFFGEIVTIMLENKHRILNTHTRFSRTRVICILE